MQRTDLSLASLSLFTPLKYLQFLSLVAQLRKLNVFFEKLLWAVRSLPHFLCVYRSLLLPKSTLFTLEEV